MSYLTNPYGRIVAVDDPEQYKNLLKIPGYKALTQQEQQEHIMKRIKFVEAMQNTKDPIHGVYLSTVSAGGKDGYGVSSSLLIRELKKLDVDVNTYYKGQKVAILFHNPYGIASIEAPYRIIYTMFESDKIPDDWNDYLKAADLVIVPSRWCQLIFAKAGIQTQVVPLGYDGDMFKFITRENKREAKKPFVFLNYNSFNARKGFLELFKAFVKEFDPTEPVKLIFKTTQDYSPLPITPQEYPNIEVILGKKTEKELLEIMARSDSFVFPSRGEGFGLTPLEAMATGLPTIVPNEHGITEYFNSEFMYEVKAPERCPGLYSRYKGQDVGKMVVCDVDDLAKQMRYVYEHQTEAMEKGAKASEYVKNWSIEKSAAMLKDVINGGLAKPIDVKRNIGNILTLEKIT